MKCDHCGRDMKKVSTTEYSVVILIILLFLGVVPGIIYALWMKANESWVCMHCLEADSTRVFRSKGKK